MPDWKEYNKDIEILFDSKKFRTNPLAVVKEILNTNPKPKLEKRHIIRMANLPLDADAINLLYKFAEQNDKDFYQAILLNDQLTKFDDYDVTLLGNLAQHAGTMFWASHATKINQFKKILESNNCDDVSVISKILANIQSEDDWYNFDSGIDELIFSKLQEDVPPNTKNPNRLANVLSENDLVKLAVRAKTLEHFKLILALPKTKTGSKILAAILNNKAFSLNNWYKPDFWRRRRPNSNISRMSDIEKLIIIPSIKDTVLLEKIAENIEKTFEKDAEGALLSTESLEVATELSNKVATNTQLNKRIAKHILNNIEVVKELSTKALNSLAKYATTDEQFKLLLSAKNADHSTADAVIQTANKVNFSGWRGVGRIIFSSLPRRIFRGIGNFFNKLFGINKASTGGVRIPNVTVAELIGDVFQQKEGADGVIKPKFDFSRMSPTSRHVLMKAVTNAEIKPGGHDEYLRTLEQAGRTPSVAAKSGTGVVVAREKPNPAIVVKSPPAKESAFNSPATQESNWQNTFAGTPSIQDKLELREPEKTRCFFKGETLGLDQARAFIEAVQLMENVSTSKPLTINADNFTLEFVEIIMQELQRIKADGASVPKVRLWFNNFNEFSPELQALVIAYNTSSPKPAPLKEEDKTDPKLLSKMAEQIDLMGQQLALGLGALHQRLGAIEAVVLETEEETNVKMPFLLSPQWDMSEPGHTKNILSFSPDLYLGVTKDDEAVQAFCNQIYTYFLNYGNKSEGCNIISLKVDDATRLENIKGILAIVEALADMKEAHKDFKMQIEFKNAEGQPINEDNFKAVGMEGQWLEFQEKITKIKEPLLDADRPHTPAPGH